MIPTEMDMIWPALLMLLLLLRESETRWLSRRNIANNGVDWKVFVAKRLPTKNGAVDPKRLPFVGNGFLAYKPYSNTIQVGGVYSGKGSKSRLARIPLYKGFTIKPEMTNGGLVLTQSYRLNIEKGYYEERTDLNRHYSGALRVYAHADPELTNTLIHEVYMRRLADAILPQDIFFEPVFLNPSDSNDVTMKCEEIPGVSREMNCSGTIKTGEADSIRPTKIYIFYTYPKMIMMKASESTASYQSIFIVDTDRERAEKSFNLAKALKATKELSRRHVEKWRARWQHLGIQIDGNKELQDLAYSSMYTLLSTLPLSNPRDFTGVVHDGISPGHVTSNQDVWTFPVALVFSPESAKQLMKYRTDRLQAAKNLAQSVGAKGAKFPWESTQTGSDVTPKNCHLCKSEACAICSDVKKYADHVTADVAMAARMYLSATEDRNWLLFEDGLALLKETAEYFKSRAEYNHDTGFFDIKGVMGPDSYQLGRQDNDIYTNIGAALAMEYASYAACLVGKSSMVPEYWVVIARKLRILINTAGKYMEPFERYNEISDPRAKKLYLPGPLMVDFPLAYNISPEYRQNNLKRYEGQLTDDPPVFAHAPIVMSWLALNETEKARLSFDKMTSYPKGPFKVWREFTSEDTQWSNPLPGASSFLSTLLFGYGGIRILETHMDIDPKCPPLSNGLKFTGVSYMDAKFTVEIHGCQKSEPWVTVTMTERRRDIMLRLQLNSTGESKDILPGMPESFPRGLVSIIPNRVESCRLQNSPTHGSITSGATPRTVSGHYLAILVVLMHLVKLFR